MKYCKNCGMLLEDSCDICIGCGLDTANPDNVSKYPPKMEKKLEAERKQNQTRRTTIIAIVIVFVLLLGLLLFIIFNSSNLITSFFNKAPVTVSEEATEVAQTEDVEDTDSKEVDYVEEDLTEEVTDAPEPTPDPNRPVKDDEGNYYSRFTLKDEGGNKVFTGLYPEDFTVNTSVIDYSKYSVRFPGRVTFSVGNSDDTVHFTYLSPEQYFHKQSETGSSLSNNRDIFYYMSYLTYGGGQGYADMLIKASYSDAKKVTLVEKKEAPESVKNKLEEMSKTFKREMRVSEMGDYAHIAEDTSYAVMGSEFSADLYKYEIVNKDKSTLFLEFYVPIMANNLYYSSKTTGDRGTVTEWITLGVYCYEAGNEDMFDDYEQAFKVFMDNCVLTCDFYNICDLREADINEAIKAEEKAEAPDSVALSGYSSKLGASLSDLDELMYRFTAMRPDAKLFVLDGYILNADPSMNVAFVNSEKEKVFISPAEDEYPGGGYLDMNVSSYDAGTISESSEGDNSEKNNAEGSDSNIIDNVSDGANII